MICSKMNHQEPITSSGSDAMCPCPFTDTHTVNNHRCWKSVCQKNFIFVKGHVCKGCPCGDDHLPENHMCTCCRRRIGECLRSWKR